MHKERIPMHKESGFLCRKRKGWQRPGYVKNTSGPGRVRKGMKEARASRRSSGARVARGENTPQHIIACQGAVVKGDIPPGGIWERERIWWGKRCEHSGDSGGARERSEHSGARVGK